MSFKNIEEKFKEYIKARRIAGASCVIFQDEKEVYRGVFGYADHKQTKRLQGNDIFRLASMTKPITACAVLILKERGALNLDTPINEYLPEFSHSGVGKIENDEVVFSEGAKSITLRNILTHSSGLGSGPIGDLQFSQMREHATLEETMTAWNKRYLDFAPGTQQRYSGIVAFELAALIVERVSGMSFNEYLERNIFTPLGMTDTTYLISNSQFSRLVDMNKTGKNGDLEKVDLGLRGFGSFAVGYTGGSAGLFSTLDDYAKFACMLAGKGAYQGKRIMSEQSVAEMRKAQLPRTFNGLSEYFNWGLGVRVCEKQGGSQPLPDGSFGWSGAYGTHFWVEPNTKRTAVLMLNKADVGGSASVYSAEFERLVSQSRIN